MAHEHAGRELSVEDADEEALYEALDWLLARQKKIEDALARRHLSERALVLYDVSSSYYEGHTCPLAQFGHNLRQRFGLSRVVLVGDRGMLTQTQIEHVKSSPGVGWISALRSPAIRKLVQSGALQMSLFDERNLAEIHSPDYPDERLVACLNPLLRQERRRKREELLAMTERALEKIVREIARRTRTPLDRGQIGLKVGKVLNAYKMGKHFKTEIADGSFAWERDEESIQAEAALDGVYIGRRRTCGRTSSCACWPTTSSGTCVRRWRRSCSMMKSSPPIAEPGILWPQPNRVARATGREQRARPPAAYRFTASRHY